jgi:hypothetical protein
MREICPSCGKPEREHVEIVMMDCGKGPVPTEVGYQPCIEQIMDTLTFHLARVGQAAEQQAEKVQ